MGGCGSGGHNKAHRTIEDYRRLDSFDLRRFIELCADEDQYEMLGPQFYNGGDILLDTAAEIRWGDRYTPLKLSWVEGIDGNRSRLYFVCPHCRQRVRYLYCYKGYFICRHCLGANYTSQQSTKESLQNLRRQMRKIVEGDLRYTWWRVDHPGETIIDLGLIPKPRYMRWEKYSCLMMKYRSLQDEYMRLWLKDVWAFIPGDMKATLSKYM